MNQTQYRRQCRSGSAGFTLIEVLVVVAIIALLISILLPSMAAAREQAKRVSCSSNLHQTALSIMSYTVSFKGDLPHYRNVPGQENILNSPLDNRYFHRDDSVTSSMSAELNPAYFVNLGHLWRARQLKDGKVLYCPSEKNPYFKYESYLPFPTRNPLDMDGHNYIRVSYNYNPHVKVKNDPRPKFSHLPDYHRLYPNLQKMPTGRTLIVDLLTGGRTNFAHLMGRDGGWNLALADGSVLFRRTDKPLEQLQDINENYWLFMRTLDSLERGLVVASGHMFPKD
ncbi:MAG TPA: prepilin-type N-terminal cleavage/methylation domain-containing protein [Phycisphaerae bacterium]|mgnify:CR=1 FL=1|nr:prepilin-type N-terminal cleavage/methylation domain-containing protein [Phycisphaerae bacterium]HOJ75533.1 prepilin-type N-terminal cleavage/methylation domain-containing protein [Phycisphaerae bacterium]HOM52830.1 prepilin-type N-terminal cleavage/methylation domain-containing protein [Phycisphaerae bacterium]HON66958.1 prepilin-type N-terminal cleavage/methylation domain-containing protein [Phycisphaerae bacterium]HOQ87906.1 prepilin-type N-terminal cleavage/methylation domain-containing 